MLLPEEGRGCQAEEKPQTPPPTLSPRAFGSGQALAGLVCAYVGLGLRGLCLGRESQRWRR